MSHIVPNTQRIYTAPHCPKDHFVLDSHRYYLTSDKALKSDYGRYGMMAPEGRGFYLKISIKEFNEAKTLFLEKKKAFQAALNAGYLKAGGIQNTFSF